MGGSIDGKAFAAKRDLSISQLSSHLAFLEEQLRDGREWLFDTTVPGLADVSVHFTLAWLKTMKTSRAVWDIKRFPYTLKWLDRVSALLKEKKQAQGASSVLSGASAADVIFASSPEAQSVVGFDQVEAQRIKVNVGNVVSVAPVDTGRTHPTVGKLVGLNLEEVVIEVTAAKGALKCHFPRLGYTIAGANSAKL